MKNEKIKKIVKRISNKIRDSKFENSTYLVGGYVRDLLLGKISADLDFVVNLPNGGVELAIFLWKNKLCSKPIIYKSFGTAMVEINKIKIEFVMTRKECYRDKNRNPEVAFGSLIEDAYRRDFTINSIYLNISSNKIQDLTNKGRLDLEKGVIRATSNPSLIFKEDPLRILRGIKFAGRLNFQIEENTYKAMIENVDSLQFIYAERIKEEFLKMLIDDGTCYSLQLCFETSAIKYIFPKLTHLNKDLLNTDRKIESLPSELVSRYVYLFMNYPDLEEVKENLIYLKVHKKQIKEILAIINIIAYIQTEHEKYNEFVYDYQNYLVKSMDICHLLGTNISNESKIVETLGLFSNRIYPLNGRKIMEYLDLKEGKLIGEYSKKAMKIWIENPNLKEEELINELKNL